MKLAGNYLSCEKGVHLQGPFLVTNRCVGHNATQYGHVLAHESFWKFQKEWIAASALALRWPV